MRVAGRPGARCGLRRAAREAGGDHRSSTACATILWSAGRRRPGPLTLRPARLPPVPKSICTSVNHQVCHGIPGDRVLKNGDIVNIDITVIKDGYHGDTSACSMSASRRGGRRLWRGDYECMWAGIAQVRAGGFLGDIGHAIHPRREARLLRRAQSAATASPALPREPQVLHYGKAGTPEPRRRGYLHRRAMINAGRREIRELADAGPSSPRTTACRRSGSTPVLVTESGYEVLTVSPQTPEPARTSRATAAARRRLTAPFDDDIGFRAARRNCARGDRLITPSLRRTGRPAAARPGPLRRPHPRQSGRSHGLTRRWRSSPSGAMAAASCSRTRRRRPAVVPETPRKRKWGAIEALIGGLWDLGLQIGHSVAPSRVPRAGGNRTSPY